MSNTLNPLSLAGEGSASKRKHTQMYMRIASILTTPIAL
jgi:hypothetical protein